MAGVSIFSVTAQGFSDLLLRGRSAHEFGDFGALIVGPDLEGGRIVGLGAGNGEGGRRAIGIE